LIQTTHGDHIVAAIADNAFFWCEHIIAVSLASSIQDIGTNAFAHCTGLESIEIPPDSSLTRIGSRAFFNCCALTGISIPSRLRALKSFCLAQCRSINTFSIPAQLEMIGDGAFSGIVIESFVVDYESRTFYAKDGVLYDKQISILLQFPLGKRTPTFEVPSSVIHIGSHSFSGHQTLKNVTVGQFLLEIGHRAFEKCPSLTRMSIPSPVNNIASCAFAECANVIDVDFHDDSSLTSIGDRPFRGLTTLAAIALPHSIDSIGEYAFAHCSAVTALRFPP
jgi:hypothetical protein